MKIVVKSESLHLNATRNEHEAEVQYRNAHVVSNPEDVNINMDLGPIEFSAELEPNELPSLVSELSKLRITKLLQKKEEEAEKEKEEAPKQETVKKATK